MEGKRRLTPPRPNPVEFDGISDRRMMTFRIEKDRFDSYLIIEFDSGRTFAIELFNLVLAPIFGLMAVTFFAMLAAIFMAIPTPLNWLLLGAFVIATGACIVAMSKR